MDIFKPVQNISSETPVQTTEHFNKTGEEGFIMIISLAIVPLLLCICFLLVAYSNYSYISLTALNTCRKHLLTGQDKIRLEMVKLIKMNPRAESARENMKKAKKVKPPPAKVAAVAIALANQMLVAGEQQIHITKAKVYGLNYTAKLTRDLRKLNKDSTITIDDFPFALDSSPALSLTPNYEQKTNFINKQEVKASWTMKNYNKKFINAIINNVHSPAIKGNCSASIDNKEGKKWAAILMKKGKL